MAQTQPFYVDDTSPAIIYTPFPDTLSVVDAIAGWNPYYDGIGYIGATGGIGNGSSFHITSHDRATLTISWKGTGIDLLGDRQGNADYQVTLDGQIRQPNSDPSRSLLASYNSLQNAKHTLTLSAMIPQDFPQASRIRFNGASLTIITPSSDYRLQAIDHRHIAFSKGWKPYADSGTSFNTSTNIGDTVQANFTGVAFSLIGNMSPNAGNYSVTLDGATTSLSAQSSASVRGVTLFFATGLDATQQHNIQVVNEDGRELSLAVSGFTVYAPDPAPASSLGASRSKGTIAALVLAGLLGFFIICGSLFFMCIIRPRRIREKRARRRRRMMRKVQARTSFLPAPSVVFPPELDMESEQATPGHHAQRLSGLSGFARWKRDVEANFENLGLGITFRHSDSTGKRAATGRRSNREEQSFSPMSSILTFSSRLSSMRRKGKTKAKSKSSSSPSVAIELPNRPESSLASLKEKEKDALHTHPFADNHSITSELSSLSYMHTPSAPVAPPSYALSHGHSDSHSITTSLSAMRFISNSTPPLPGHSRKSVSLPHADPLPGSSQKVSVPPQPEHLTSLISDPGCLSTIPPRDRGSAQYSSDDTGSSLGSAAARLAIRELSPRTSEFTEHPPPVPVIPLALEKETISGLVGPVAITTDKLDSNELPSSVQKIHVSPQEDSDSSFLHIVSPPTEPNEVPLSPPRHDTIREIPSSVPPNPNEYAFQMQAHQHVGKAIENKSQPQERNPKKKPVSHHFLSIFRLGHPSSFIDFTSSTSSDASNNSQPGPSAQTEQRHKSHGSQVTQHTHSGSSGTSMSVISPTTTGGHSYFPYPVALPPSPHHPEGHISSSASRSMLSRIDPRQIDRRPGIRLSAFISPTESVPMSVTENELSRVSLSVEPHITSDRAHLPPHPPLPDIHKSNSTLI